MLDLTVLSDSNLTNVIRSVLRNAADIINVIITSQTSKNNNIMKTKKYTELTINQRINYKSGWDIAIAYEGRETIAGSTNRPYCKLTICLGAKIPLRECQRDYNDCQRHRILNGGRVFVKQN